jgi:cytochrome c
MSGLGFNKIAGAVLGTGLAVIGLNELSSGMFEPVMAKKMGYLVEVKDDSAGAKPEVDLPPDWGTILATADVKAGQDTFAKCSACHKPTDENNTGPGLNGVLGRAPASHPGFAYSDAMKAFAGTAPVWDYDHVYQFIKKPQAYISGTKMTFAGLKNPQDRINVIAYLHTLGSNLPIPKPDPARAAAIEAAKSGGAAPAAGAAPAGAAPAAPAGAAGPVPSPSGANTAAPAGAPGAPAAAAVTTSTAGPAKN